MNKYAPSYSSLRAFLFPHREDNIMKTPTETHAIIMRTIEMAVKPHTGEDLYVTLANMATELIHELAEIEGNVLLLN